MYSEYKLNMSWTSKRVKQLTFKHNNNEFTLTASHYVNIDDNNVKTVISCKKSGEIETIAARELENHLLEGMSLLDEMCDFKNYVKQEKI